MVAVFPSIEDELDGLGQKIYEMKELRKRLPDEQLQLTQENEDLTKELNEFYKRHIEQNKEKEHTKGRFNHK